MASSFVVRLERRRARRGLRRKRRHSSLEAFETDFKSMDHSSAVRQLTDQPSRLVEGSLLSEALSSSQEFQADGEWIRLNVLVSARKIPILTIDATRPATVMCDSPLSP